MTFDFRWPEGWGANLGPSFYFPPQPQFREELRIAWAFGLSDGYDDAFSYYPSGWPVGLRWFDSRDEQRAYLEGYADGIAYADTERRKP